MIILPRGSGYKKGTAIWWQPTKDQAITVKVNTKHSHCILVSYCVNVERNGEKEVKDAQTLWNSDVAHIFTCYMENKIKYILQGTDFNSKLLNRWVDQISEIAQEKLKSMEIPKLK